MANYTTCRLVVRGPLARVEELMAFVRGNPEPVTPPTTDGEMAEIRALASKLTGHQYLEALERGIELAAMEDIDVGEEPSEAMKIWLVAQAADSEIAANESGFAFSLNRILPVPLAILLEGDRTIADWTSNNWGDRWCELNSLIAFDDDGMARRDYFLTTPWKPTIDPMIALMEQFEDLDIVYLWTESGNDLAGILFRDESGEIDIINTPYSDISALLREDEKGEPLEDDDGDDEDDDEPVTDSEVMEYLCNTHLGEGVIEIVRNGGIELC